MPFPWMLHRLLPFGRSSEILAAKYLRSQGYRIAASGFRVKEGEVDLIAWDGEILVFVEVKSLRSSNAPEDAVTHTKKQRIGRAARAYIARHKLHESPYRFDVVAINRPEDGEPQIRLNRDAFRVSN